MALVLVGVAAGKLHGFATAAQLIGLTTVILVVPLWMLVWRKWRSGKWETVDASTVRDRPALYAAALMLLALLAAIVVPNPDEQDFIHSKYMGELFVGTILDATRTSLTEIAVSVMQRDGVDGLILGGTELSLIFREPTAAGLPVLDTTQVHSTPRSSGYCVPERAIASRA